MLRIKVDTAAKGNFGGLRSLDKIKYIVIHYTANKGDTAQNNADYFKRNIVEASAHFFVDEENIVQSVPDNFIAYSVGGKKYPNTNGGTYYGKCTNTNSINIEMCDSFNSVPEKTLSLTVELTKTLMKKYNIPIENVIRHYDVTGKVCPKPFVNNESLWLDFKRRLIEVRYNTIDELPDWARPTIQKLVDEKKIADGNNLDLSEDMVRVLVIMSR